MNQQPNIEVIIAYLKRRGITYEYEKPYLRRMNYCGDDYDFVEIISEAKNNYTMDNQSNTRRRMVNIADKKG